MKQVLFVRAYACSLFVSAAVWSSPPASAVAPNNDNFENRMPLSANLLVTGRTLEATTEEGEPADGLKSV